MALAIGDVMKKDVITVEPGMSVADMDRLFLSSHISGAPVVADGKLLGVVSRTDVIRTLLHDEQTVQSMGGYYGDPAYLPPSLLRYVQEASRPASERLEKLSVEEIMNRHLITALADDPIESVAKTMASQAVHRILVTDASGERLLGLVSSLDMARLVWELGLASH